MEASSPDAATASTSTENTTVVDTRAATATATASPSVPATTTTEAQSAPEESSLTPVVSIPTIAATSPSGQSARDNPNTEATIFPTTPAESTTAATPTAAATVFMPTFEEMLLREWTHNPNPVVSTRMEHRQHNHHHPHVPPHVPPATMTTEVPPPAEAVMMPPVAPAVVLSETSEGSSSASNATRTYNSYPVATFVSNFVRSSVNEIRDHMAHHIYAATAVATAAPTPGDESLSQGGPSSSSAAGGADPLSIRSEPARLVAEVPPAASRSMVDEDANTEFVLIDGDLVAIPAIRPHHTRADRRRSRRSHLDEEEEDYGEGDETDDDDDHGSLLVPRAAAATRQQPQHMLAENGHASQYHQHQDRFHHHHLSEDGHINRNGSNSNIPLNGGNDGAESEYNAMEHSSSYANHHSTGAILSSSINPVQHCRPNHSRMHRGMRKVKKWMKKKNLLPRRNEKKKPSTSKKLLPEGNEKMKPPALSQNRAMPRHLQEQSDSQLLQHQQQAPLMDANTILTSTSASVAEDETIDDATTISSVATRPITSNSPYDEESIATTTTDEGPASPSRRKKAPKKRRSRLGWPRVSGDSASGGGESIASSADPRQILQQQRTGSGSSLSIPHEESAATTSLDAPLAATRSLGVNVASLPGQPATPPPSAAAAVASLPSMNTSDPLSLHYAASATPSSLGLPPAHSESAFASPAASSTYAMATPEANASLLTLDAHETPSLNRQHSIAAEYVGNADQLLQAGVLPESVLAAEAYIEDRLDDYDKYDKKDSYYMRSMVPRDADFKVDKQDAPSFDAMLRRAGEFAEDLEASAQDSPLMVPQQSLMTATKGKSDGESVPLSSATIRDKLVHNDVLKLVMVGDALVDKSALARSLRKSSKKAKKRTTLGVDVHSWTPPNDDDVRFTIWDVQGASKDASPYDANFGAHPGTQSLFFSDRSLYLLVWDLASNNRKTYRRRVTGEDDSDDEDFDEDEEDENEYLCEEANRQADRALQADIEDRVLSWVDCIARRGPHSAILPIALVSGGMSPEEAKRRCDTMQTLMMRHTERMENAPKVLSGAETVLCVSLDTNMGMDLLQETILAIATDASHSVFDHVGTPVPVGTTMVLETARRLKQDHKLVLVDHLMAELTLLKGETGMILSVEQVMEALHFLASIGEVLYFGGVDDVLSHYVILSRKWMVSAISCILRNDLNRELDETRRFMNMQCLYSDQQFPENHVTQTFSGNPLLSSSDTRMLWQSMSFMREAADKSSELQENSTTNSTMFGFLEHLLVHTGVFLPLDIDRLTSPDMVYFVPSLLAQSNSRDIWTYKSSESWMTNLAHSWLFRDGVPSGLMEHVTVALLRDLYEFSHIVATSKHRSPPPRSQTFPFAQNSLHDFMDNHDGEAIGHIKIHHMMCWKNSLLIKIGCVFPDGDELKESFSEIFVSIADPSSPHIVASDAMRSNMQRLIVSGKGQVGHHGRKLWKGGYSLVLDSIKASVADCTNVDRQVVCPECLAHSHPSSASTWSWDSVRAAAETGSDIVRCMRGHRVDSNLICGTMKAVGPKTEGVHNPGEAPKKPVKDLLPSLVLVGLWDCATNSVRNVGSGFIADKKQGLVVTAGHILFDMDEGRHFGTPYLGLKHAKVVIGVIPEGARNTSSAVFRYFAEIVADDIHSMDACVLKITSRLEADLDDEGSVGEQPVKEINPQEEQLPILKMTRRFELEETVRILGFNQAGEGRLKQGKHVNRTADFAKGYICKQFKLADDHSDSDSESSGSEVGFSPREEIVIMCPTIPGHSGGPCVNEEGRVVGILSRADPVDRQRCYLVPSSELKILVTKAKKSFSRSVGRPKQIY